MRVAVISDIHGNAHALEAVLADIADAAPDAVLNLGDCLSGVLEAGRTADMLMAQDFPTVSGNHDRWLHAPREGDPGGWEICALRELNTVHLDWLRALPPTRVIADEIFMCHATPKDDVTPWLDVANALGNIDIAPQDSIEAHGADCDYPVILCGHTHIARAVSLNDGRLVVNPGSVGSPGFKYVGPSGPVRWSAASPHARYAILDKSRFGWSVDFCAVAYDYRCSADIARATGDPDMAHALLTGWIGD